MFRHPTHRSNLAVALAMVAVLVAPGTVLAAPGQLVKVKGVDLNCELESADASGTLVASARDRSDGSGFAFVDLLVEPKDPDAAVLAGGMDRPALTKAGMDAAFDMVDVATDATAGSATVSAAFTVTGSQHFVAIYQDGTQKGIFYTLRVVGTVGVTSGALRYTFDMSACDASAQTRTDRFHDRKPPKPGARQPANDLPASALPVAAGSHVQIQTDGASVGSEADCVQTFDDGDFSLPFGRTVWFEVSGTGRPITIDPAGSDFDTVVAAYVQTGAGLDQVACIDDGTGPLNTPKQAAVTIDTQPGATYLVQIGGIGAGADAEFGHLRVKVY